MRKAWKVELAAVVWFFSLSSWGAIATASDLRLSSFEIDVTPPVGSPLAYDPMREATGPLSCRGVVLESSVQEPIVLCTVDWLGVANLAGDEFRAALAAGVDTTPERVVVHALHQHDAPRCDLSAAEILSEQGLAEAHYDVEYLRDCFRRAGKAASKCLKQSQAVTAISLSRARVHNVASNRRMLGPDGKVHTTRYTACRDPRIRALPEGVIDPWLQSLAFYGESGPLAVLTCYATHPQSYYRTGQANPDFPGMARDARQAATGVFHLHFNGAGGNIGAGKYNDGDHENRQVLADKVATAMEEAWDKLSQSRQPTPQLTWRTRLVRLPLGAHVQKESLRKILTDPATESAVRLNTAKKLAFLDRTESGHQIQISCLQLGSCYVLFMPGELFVEYQLAAQEMRPEATVLMAAYGEYGTGYIGTRVAYPQGGYEVSQRASNVAPESELVLVQAMRDLLQATDRRVLASDFTDRVGPLPEPVVQPESN